MKVFLDFLLNKKFYLPLIYISLGLFLYIVLKNVMGKIKFNDKGYDKRKDTIVNLIKNIIKYVIVIFVSLAILKVFGVDTSSIFASLGIFAAVIGLAFQDIIKDFLAGITIIFDNKYAVGDIVEINGFKGTVISLGLRTTKIKAFTGEIKSIGNSSFTEVINYNLMNSELFLKLNVSYDTNIDTLENILLSIKEDILNIEDVLNYELLGVDELGDSSIVYMVHIISKPTTALIVKRKALKIIKEVFDKNNINIPYTQVDINIKK